MFIVSNFNFLMFFDFMKKNDQLKGSEALLLKRTMLSSCYSTAANVLDCFGLEKVVQLFLPSCSADQYDALMRLIGDEVVCILPLKKGTMTLVYCDFLNDFNAEQCLFVYQQALEVVFCKKDGRLTQPYSARLYEIAKYEEEI